MSDDCIFCRIVAGDIPAEVLLETEHSLVFKDVNPATPVHYLAVPKKHLATLNDLSEEDREIMGDLCLCAARAAKQLGIDQAGYRLVVNTNQAAGQVVFHIHCHLMGGRAFGWPPG